MSRRYFTFTLLLPLFLLVSGSALPPQQTPEKAAQEAAESWLRLIDAGKYAESWDELAEITKAKVSKESWANSHNDAATPNHMDGGEARTLSRAISVSGLFGFNKQPGVVLDYRIHQDSHRWVGELVELVLEPDRGWRVAFYMKMSNTLLFNSENRDGLSITSVPPPSPDKPSTGIGTGGGMGTGGGVGPGAPSPGRGVGSAGVATAVDSRPVPLNAPKPRYTDEARDNKVQGSVVARILVGEDGSVKQVKIVRGLPAGLNEEAERSAYELRFKPAMKDGKPVPFWMTVSIEFHLR